MDEISGLNSPSDTDGLDDASTLNESRTRLQAGQLVARRYEIVRRVGRGGMGEVWHAYDVKLRVDVALKSMRRTTPESVEALRREVRTAREIISPNVCRIFDLVVEEGQEFVSMEYIDGLTLFALLREKSPFNLGEARELASQFLAGLEAIHQAGLIHRDVKPENIMITRTGRVVVMDFGIAKPLAQLSETSSGTPPYMAPERLARGRVDARADVFAAGVVLAEMISPIRDRKLREMVWNAIREDPPKLPESPWQSVIARAISKNPEDRFASAGALARALEDVTQRIETVEERKPYPGLSSFTEADAEYFFGRELEAETLLKKLQELHLLAIIGPSGGGKTSFLRAGLIPVLPASWSHVFTVPGDSPLVNLGQALAAEFSGDTEAIRKMVRLNDVDVALWLLHRWRQKHSETILIADRFEELFTLNDREVQTRFAELLGRAVLEADIRLLLAVRDDFLIFCKEHASLAPIFSELTALLPLTGPALRRALIQPALQCGYRFEDESLVDEILCDVEKERGALPLMAFAAARLWEKRDRKDGLLTSAAYQQIGGVAGALAQHAEATMDRIGTERQPIVREIFRNLVTAQNTRAARDTEEILSIFENRQSAEEVLRSLIDARLLSSFEAPAHEGEKLRRRVEIIHESLLSAWPRLIRWQTQDADSAQFRDQLRQAAQVWEERGRPVDLLWTGGSYKEFEVWREKYLGGLTSTEKSFADAMLYHARKQRVQRRIFVSATFVILLGILGVIATFWRSEKQARQTAVSEAKRAEASKLLALGRTELDQDPANALGYAIASLERADTQVARRFAVQALWKGPPAFIMKDMPIRPTFLNFSPDGKWLAAGGPRGVRLVSHEGKRTFVLDEGIPATEVHRPRIPQFAPNSDFVIWTAADDPRIVRVWSISKRKEVRRFQMEGATISLIRGPKLILITDLTGKTAATKRLEAFGSIFTLKWEQCRIRTWKFDENEPGIVGHWNRKDITNFDISSDAKQLAYAKDRSVYIRAVQGNGNRADWLVGSHNQDVTRVSFHPDAKQIASADSKGEIRMWTLSKDSKTPFHTIAPKGPVLNIFFNSSGSIFAASYYDKTLCAWDMNGPGDADPLILRRGVTPFFPYFAFDPSNRYAVVSYSDSLAFWPLNHVYPYVLHGDGDHGAGGLEFTPDGKHVVAAFMHGSIRLWQMDHPQTIGRDLWRPSSEMYRMDIHPTGKQLAIATNNDGANVISIADGKSRRMPGIGTGAVSFSPSGRFLAAESYGTIRLWDMESDKVRILNAGKGTSKATRVRFSPEGRLFSGHENGNLYEWDIEKETSRLVAKGNKQLEIIQVAKNAPHMLLCLWNDYEQGIDLQQARSELRVVDLRTANSYPIITHGNRIGSVGVDPSGALLVTGDMDGILRVGPITGEEPHLLFSGHERLRAVAVHPDRHWIATAEGSKPILLLWPMPVGKPLHTLPYDELLKRLRALTNVRVVTDENSSTGYRIQFDPFPGWEKAPNW